MKFTEIRKNGKTEGCFYACEQHGNEIKWYAMAKKACGAEEPSPESETTENPNPTENSITYKCLGKLPPHTREVVGVIKGMSSDKNREYNAAFFINYLDPDRSACRFDCDLGYFWNGDSCVPTGRCENKPLQVYGSCELITLPSSA